MAEEPKREPFGASMPDFEKLAQNSAKLVEQTGRVVAAYLRPRETAAGAPVESEEAGDMIRSLGRVAEAWFAQPQRAMEAQAALAAQMVSLWSNTLQSLHGEPPAPIAAPEQRDGRFKDKEWSENPFFDFLKQAYLISSAWAADLVERAEGLPEHDRAKARFYVKQLAAAASPSNFVLTNPELIRATLAESGDNLVRGMEMLGEDIAAGKGTLRIRQSDPGNFEVGVNMATTPGKVIFRNTLLELIQYTPTTETVRKRPLLIIPPWINKFYILDLNPEKSFIRWAVSEGVSVFVVSWVNPDERHKDYGFASYMHEGVLAAIDAVLRETGEDSLDTMGYCVGGTLLAVTMAWLAAHEDRRIASATLLTAQVDFTHAGDLKVFVDEEQIRAVERLMAQFGYLPAAKMANAFNMLRPLDLIWPYVVNTYLKGRSPMAFDLLYWNADSTRMPEANHRFYLRNCYLENRLAKGEMEIDGVRLDLSLVTAPIYNLAAKEDHIAPARSAFVGSALFGGPVRYVMAGSGHIAGVVNPVAKPKYQYWTGAEPRGELEDWAAGATEHPGSWWSDWMAWLQGLAAETVPARLPGRNLAALADAPGEYVRVKA